jgi:hypothetical protein
LDGADGVPRDLRPNPGIYMTKTGAFSEWRVTRPERTSRAMGLLVGRGFRASYCSSKPTPFSVFGDRSCSYLA